MRQDTDERAIVLFPDRARLLKNSLSSLPTAPLAIPVIKDSPPTPVSYSGSDDASPHTFFHP